MIGGFFQLENIKIPVCIIHHSCNDIWWRLLKMRDWSPHTALWRFLRTWQNKLGRTCLNINLHSDPLRRRPWDEGVLVTMLWPYSMSSLIHPWKKIRVNWNMILCTATEKKKLEFHNARFMDQTHFHFDFVLSLLLNSLCLTPVAAFTCSIRNILVIKRWLYVSSRRRISSVLN